MHKYMNAYGTSYMNDVRPHSMKLNNVGIQQHVPKKFNGTLTTVINKTQFNALSNQP